MATEKYNPAEMVKALEKSAGMISVAARSLGCSRQTIYSYADKYPEVKRAIDEARTVMLDDAEHQLAIAVQRGDPWAIKFALKTLGTHGRGYVQRREITGANGEEIRISLHYANEEDDA